MAAPSSSCVDLGFVEEIEDKWRLLSHFFPSKIGGKPAWLALNNLPTVTDLRCKNCEKPCVFLLQVYSPLVDKQNCFHRTIFIFICPNPGCSNINNSNNIIIWRSQIPKDNQFFSSSPADESKFDAASDYPKAEKWQKLCCVCGCPGSKQCAKCHAVTYCGRDHQIVDWKASHKQTCLKDSSTGTQPDSTILFPEFELVTEAENFTGNVKSEKSENEKMAEFEECVKHLEEEGTLLAGDEASKDLENMAAGLENDKQFFKFKERVVHEPEQVLRYDRGGVPLWVSAEYQPTSADLPKCSCGADRIFEFQVMPQLLLHLEADSVGSSMDWGTLAVYTCSQSCDTSTYNREFVWKQDYSNTNTA